MTNGKSSKRSVGITRSVSVIIAGSLLKVTNRRRCL
jgi:hypothetical protein